jgi:17beta-estradiol 17-dehydrogenase / very-long-chain 3-oxoacyl-CoA reductase
MLNRVNVLALTQVTAAVLPVMLHRGRGTIVNISSGSALALPSFPLYSVYAGTKRYAIKQILSKFSLETHIQK